MLFLYMNSQIVFVFCTVITFFTFIIYSLVGCNMFGIPSFWSEDFAAILTRMFNLQMFVVNMTLHHILCSEHFVTVLTGISWSFVDALNVPFKVGRVCCTEIARFANYPFIPWCVTVIWCFNLDILGATKSTNHMLTFDPYCWFLK